MKQLLLSQYFVLEKVVVASGQLTVICHTTADDVALSFSMQSVCPFLLINVVFLTLSLLLVLASILFAAIYLKSQVLPFIYLYVYLSWQAIEI